MVPVDSDRIPRVPPYLGFLLFTVSLRVRDFHTLRSGFPTRFHFLHSVRLEVLQPRKCRNIHGLGYSPFDRHYSENRFFFLFLQVLRCFSSLRWHASLRDWPSASRVAPFGYPRIKSSLQIPAAFRSLPRPSSPIEAKASSVRP